MAHRSATTTIEYKNNVWRVCVAGMCKEHQQEWQARVFYHQMTASDALHPHVMASNMVDP
jgi:hypothetical protein